MEVDVSSSLRDSTSNQITVPKAESENLKNKKVAYHPECGINRSNDDKKDGENCSSDANNLNPVVVENSEEVGFKKKNGSVCENNCPDNAQKSGENCMENGTNLNSMGDLQCKLEKLKPGKRGREALCLNGLSKPSSEVGAEVNAVAAAEKATSLPGSSIVDNDPSLGEDAVANSCTELPDSKRTKIIKGKHHSCNDSDNAGGSTSSTLKTECRPNSEYCSSTKLVSTEGVAVIENSADLGDAIADASADFPQGATAESDTNIASQKRKEKNRKKRQNSNDSITPEPSIITSIFDTECKASNNNCSSKETILTEEAAITESRTNLQHNNKMNKRMKKKEDPANEELICEEGPAENKQTSLSSSPIKSATETTLVSVSVTTENVPSGSSCISNTLAPKILVSPDKKKLLVLDINGLLADINSDFRYSEHADFKISGKSVFKRPFCADFLNFCFANFEIGIWSSRKKYNVEQAVQHLMGSLRDKLLFCWDQSKCTATNFNTIDNSCKPLVFKELKKLWEKEEPDLPWEKGRFTPSNTLLVDDSPYKAFCNPPFTAIFPAPYSFKHKEDNLLGDGGDLRVYLEKVATAKHVQYYVKDNPFGQPAITDSHPNWKFYLRIIENLDKPLNSA